MNTINTNSINDATNTMFCRQCQETFGNSGCTRAGVCGKQPQTAALMDELVARLEDLAAERPPTRELGRFVTLSLFLTLTNANFDNERLMSAVAETDVVLLLLDSKMGPTLQDKRIAGSTTGCRSRRTRRRSDSSSTTRSW